MGASFVVPMSMRDFFQASRGQWMTRRAVHHLDHQDDEFADSNLIIEPFDRQDPVTAKVCENLSFDLGGAAGGARFWWESNLKESSRSEDYAAVLVDAPNPSDPTRGFLLRDKGYVEKKPVLSEYSFAADGLLTITTRYDTNVGIERCWFVTDQVRMRVSSVQFLDGVSMTTYCTEFRCPSADDLAATRRQAEALASRYSTPGG